MLIASPAAATLPLFLPQAPPDKVSGLFHAATLLAQLLGQGRALDSRALRSAMEAAFGGTDAEGAWVWKDAYEALEAAQVLFLRKFGSAMRSRAGSAAAMLEMLTRLAGAAPVADPPLGRIRALPAVLDAVGTRLCRCRGGSAVPQRRRARTVGRHRIAGDLRRARQSAACLERDRRDPRRTARPPVPRRCGHPAQRRADPRPSRCRDPAERRADEPALLGLAPYRGPLRRSRDAPHRSALARLAEGGRLVAITGHNIGPDQPAWRAAFVRLQEKAVSSSPRRSPAGPMSATVRDRDAADGHRPYSGPRMRTPFRRLPAWPPIRRNYLTGNPSRAAAPAGDRDNPSGSSLGQAMPAVAVFPLR